MPELPDVEHFRRLFADHVAGKVIGDVEVRSATIVRHIDADTLRTELLGRRIGRAERHGKRLFVATDGPQLVLHFGMTGSLRWSTDGERHITDRVAIGVEGGCLVIDDRRNLATVTLVAEGGDRGRSRGRSGPTHGRSRRASWTIV